MANQVDRPARPAVPEDVALPGAPRTGKQIAGLTLERHERAVVVDGRAARAAVPRYWRRIAGPADQFQPVVLNVVEEDVAEDLRGLIGHQVGGQAGEGHEAPVGAEN